MSLLLEALRKAEKAKEEAQRQAKAEIGERPTGAAAAPLAAPGDAARRTEPHDRSQPLDRVREDLRADRPVPSQPLALEPEAPADSETAGASGAPPEPAREEPWDSRGRDRRPEYLRVEEPFREPNPRLPFHAALGVLGAIALAGIGYFWYQLRPAQTLVNPNPPGRAAESRVDAGALKPQAASAAQDTRGPAGTLTIPGLPAVGAIEPAASSRERARSAPAEKSAPKTASEPPVATAAPAPSTVKASSARPAAGGAGSAVDPARLAPPRAPDARRAEARIHPQVLSAYAAYHVGDLASARSAYQLALTEEPANRDALLGMAAIEMRAQRYEQSAAYYERLLQADPRDPHAHAGMLALRSQHIDPVRAESRLKNLLATDPAANVLYFTLGNQYAQQERWADAQQAYFKAYAADSENPDVAFNLAVSLDHLRQTALALEYYRRALALAQKRAAGFDPQVVRQRELELSR